MKKLLLMSAAGMALPGLVAAACPAVTVADPQGIAAGAYPQQYDLAAFQEAASCELSFATNPAMSEMNAQIKGNGDLPALAERLPAEPLVVAPYDEIGQYGGTFEALSNATESGTSDFLSVRHVNLVRYSDDLQTIVPNVAKSWEWNDDFTQLTVSLRKGHKWSDGMPFTAADVVFWYDNLMMDTNVIAEAKGYALAGGEPMEVVALDETTVQFTLKAPKPGLLETFASSYVQPYQPKHFFGQFHPALAADADEKARALGYEGGYDLIKAYYGNSDWTDTPSPMLTAGDKLAGLPKATTPTLESHILVDETAEGRHFVANPYFFMVDTAGNQLPYISELNETYIGDAEVRNLKMINGEVSYKTQAVSLDNAPLLLENQEKGGYTIDIKPTISMVTLAFNVTHEDDAKRDLFNDLNFRTAMSVAINRAELNETVYFGMGTPQQYVGFSPLPEFIDSKWQSHAAEFDADKARALLDEIGVVDQDGDGMRDLPNGERLVLNWQFSTQSTAASLAELIARNWTDIGIETQAKEVTSDEYRSAQSANQLEVLSWGMGQPAGTILGDNQNWVPPYSDYFGIRPAMGWAEYISSDGAAGIEPPQWATEVMDALAIYQSSVPGSDASNAAAVEMVEKMTGNLLLIGTVLAPAPVYVDADLKNVPEFRTSSYEYYRSYPYRAHQWFLAD
ncbi:ABC transporter substrate-binding protein [Phaeobacter sp. B1627]|uniref:ABC transporter substrate-binding protein n=1 Tax=Phaeobacter sp. B1627 TaxID=2583809 RepID=UPI001119ADDD|nr:ABC transporter substrate-binding protein [Phaeobacter sp. B1627]TNJ47804.1 ABC transporter substrate-binding protein [Phaeobacter sp. B1627]